MEHTNGIPSFGFAFPESNNSRLVATPTPPAPDADIRHTSSPATQQFCFAGSLSASISSLFLVSHHYAPFPLGTNSIGIFGHKSELLRWVISTLQVIQLPFLMVSPSQFCVYFLFYLFMFSRRCQCLRPPVYEIKWKGDYSFWKDLEGDSRGQF